MKYFFQALFAETLSAKLSQHQFTIIRNALLIVESCYEEFIVEENKL
jgi:hypothetical protein